MRPWNHATAEIWHAECSKAVGFSVKLRAGPPARMPQALIFRGGIGMPVLLLLLFAIAMSAVVVGKLTVSAAGIANLTCLCLLVLIALVLQRRGIRKPVV